MTAIDRDTPRTLRRGMPPWLLATLLVGCAGAPPANSAEPSAANPPDPPAATGGKAECPDVPKPSPGRYQACEQKGGQLTGVETDGCVRGYDCVLP